MRIVTKYYYYYKQIEKNMSLGNSSSLFLTTSGSKVETNVKFNPNIALGGSAIMRTKAVTEPITFNAVNPVSGSWCIVELIADGINVPAFLGFTEHSSSSTYDNTAGYTNLVHFFVIGDKSYYSISQPKNQSVIDSYQLADLKGYAPTNIFGLRRLYTPYKGPAIRLLREYDNTEKDFYFQEDGNLPRAEIQSWAFSNTSKVITIYDQYNIGNTLSRAILSGRQNDVKNYPTLTLVNSIGFPEITWASANRMETRIPTQVGQTEFSSVFHAKNIDGAGFFLRQDLSNGPMQFGPGVNTYYGPIEGVNTNVGQTVSGDTNNWRSWGGTLNSKIDNGQKIYKTGSVVATSNSGKGLTFNPSVYNGPAQMGYFRHYSPSFWVGSWDTLAVFSKSLPPEMFKRFSDEDTVYYATPLPALGAAPSSVPGLIDAPVISGASQPDMTITVSNGVWSMSPTSYTYQWKMDGVDIAGATSSTYTIGSGSTHIGKTPTCAVRAINVVGTSDMAGLATGQIVHVYQNETPFSAPTDFVTLKSYNKGMNYSGAESAKNTIPGTMNTTYYYPSPASLSYYMDKGMSVFRIPFLIERVAPQAYEPLLETHVNALKSLADAAGRRGCKIILDPHDYGLIRGKIIGIAPGSDLEFAEFWSRMATKFKNYPNVIFGLMNEPSQTDLFPQVWKAGCLPAIKAIRDTGATQLILIPGVYFTGAHSWTTRINNQDSNAQAWAGYNGDVNFAYEMHQYLDSNQSGANNTCAVYGNRLAAATAWLISEGKKGFLAEFSWSNLPECSQPSTDLMNALKNSPDAWMGWTYWWAFDWIDHTTDKFDITPVNGVDKPQMTKLISYIN